MRKVKYPCILLLIVFTNLLLIYYKQYSTDVTKQEYKRLKVEKEECYHELNAEKSLFYKIPKVFHYTWISPFLNETNNFNMEVRVRENIQTCLDLHRKWSYTIWTDDLVRREFPQLIDLLIAASVPSVISDILRMNILARYGGIYLDTDFLCLRSFEPLLKQQFCTAFAGSEVVEQDNVTYHVMTGALIGAIPGHFILQRAAELILDVALGPEPPNVKTGPYFLEKMVNLYNTSTACMYVYNPKRFYPCDFFRRKECHTKLAEYKEDPDIYAIHLWYASWVVGLDI